jgi:hypothetical protein
VPLRKFTSSWRELQYALACSRGPRSKLGSALHCWQVSYEDRKSGLQMHARSASTSLTKDEELLLLEEDDGRSGHVRVVLMQDWPEQVSWASSSEGERSKMLRMMRGNIWGKRDLIGDVTRQSHTRTASGTAQVCKLTVYTPMARRRAETEKDARPHKRAKKHKEETAKKDSRGDKGKLLSKGTNVSQK